MKQYLGDGVYAESGGYAIILTTEDGINVTNTIMLDPEVYVALLAWVEKLRVDAFAAKSTTDRKLLFPMAVPTEAPINTPTPAPASLTYEAWRKHIGSCKVCCSRGPSMRGVRYCKKVKKLERAWHAAVVSGRRALRTELRKHRNL
jgi:hypothetical protein